MKASDLTDIKSAIKTELARRDGFGDVSQYAGAQYDFTSQPTVGESIKPEYGQKTIDLFLKIKDYKDLRNVQLYDSIPEAFGRELIDVCAQLSQETRTGESANSIAALHSALQPESSSCRTMCTGLCVGSCISMCNGCGNNCSDTCGTGCTNGCNTTCTGSAFVAAN